MNQSSQENRFMEFKLAQQAYAIPLLDVKEVIQKPEVTPVPNMPPHFEGMINLRGQILGVFNLRKKIGAKSPKSSSSEVTSEVVIVIEKGGLSIGMVVDEVTKVLHPTPESIRPAPLKDNDPARLFITSVIQTGEDLVLSLDLSELLDLEKYKFDKKVA